MKYSIKSSLAKTIPKDMTLGEPLESRLKNRTVANHINIGKITYTSNIAKSTHICTHTPSTVEYEELLSLNLIVHQYDAVKKHHHTHKSQPEHNFLPQRITLENSPEEDVHLSYK
jgi:hypothetical protein